MVFRLYPFFLLLLYIIRSSVKVACHLCLNSVHPLLFYHNILHRFYAAKQRGFYLNTTLIS